MVCTLWSVLHQYRPDEPTSESSQAVARTAAVFLISDDPSSVRLRHRLPDGVLSSPLLDPVYMSTRGATTYHIDIPSMVGLGVDNGSLALAADAAAAAPNGDVNFGYGAGLNMSAMARAALRGAAVHPARLPSLVEAAAAARGDPIRHAEAVAAATGAFIGAFVDLVALSACDVVVHTKSGFSKSAVEWGGLSPKSVRMLPRAPKADDAFIAVLPGCGPGSYIPLYYKIMW